jgi:hypothetical protein
MPTIRFHATTSVPVRRVVEALTDFTGSRPELWPNLDRSHYQVHGTGPNWADVTEGSRFAGGVWERGTYRWSDEGNVRLDVTESNTFAPGSSWEYRVSRDEAATLVDATVVRIPATLKSRMLAVPLRLFGARMLRGDLEKTLRMLESAASTDAP